MESVAVQYTELLQAHQKAIQVLHKLRMIKAHATPEFAQFGPRFAFNPNDNRDTTETVTARHIRESDWLEFQEYRKLVDSL